MTYKFSRMICYISLKNNLTALTAKEYSLTVIWSWLSECTCTHCFTTFYIINPFTAKFSQKQISTKFPNFILWNFEKQIAPCVSTGRELSFEWSHHRISSTDSKVRVTLQNSIKYSGSEKVKRTDSYQFTNKYSPEKNYKTEWLTDITKRQQTQGFQLKLQ